ncbi:MAG TPA: endopeptidase La, partial [Firmicutes bacterium]|nr:endopeptidase La [Bacillota bacterium]
MPESEIKQESSSSLTLPLLIVRSLVVFPSVSENIEASRDFSVKSIELAQSETNNQIVIVSQKDENIDNPEFKDIYDVGTLCKIVSSTSSDSRVKIRVVGSKRVKITSIVNKDGAFFGTFEFGESYEENVLNEVDLVKKIVDFISSNPSIAHSIPRSSLSQLGKGISPSELPDTIASFLPLNNSQRQRILNQFNPENRLKELLAILNEIKSSAEIEADLQNKVRVSAEKSQKEYFLREKMKAIRQELGESSDAASSEDKVKEKLEKNPYPENVKAKIKSELKRYEMMPEASLESSLIMSYIETLLSVPWFEKTEDDMDLNHVKKVLDEDHFGLEKVKKRIIEYLAVKKMTGNLKAPILCFYGPPGCGKTSL